MSSKRVVPWRRPMVGRDRDEKHRTSTPLELFFDLCFAVSVASAASQLTHGIENGQPASWLGYSICFFCIWWAWVNYSWLASAYDSGDVLFRVLTFVQMAGVLVMATGVPNAFNGGELTVVVIGYVIMRVPLVALWLRVAFAHPDARAPALRYAGGILLMQIYWVARLWFPQWLALPALFVGGAGELLVPVFAERAGNTPWNREHVVDRYSCFTLIVLGEVLLATSQAIGAVLHLGALTPDLTLLIAGALLIVFGMWWVYFKRSGDETLVPGGEWLFGYGHYLILGATAAVGSSLAAAVEIGGKSDRATTVATCLAATLCTYLLAVGVLHRQASKRWHDLISAVACSALVAGVVALHWPVGVTVLAFGVVVSGAVVQHVALDNRSLREEPRA